MVGKVITMNIHNHDSMENTWICPNDRELMLRAKLQSGWSFRTNQYRVLGYKKPEKLNEDETKMITDVLQRAKASEELDKRRINKMLERLQIMKMNARGDGKTTCLLCDEQFGLFRLQSHKCQICDKLICSKCGVDTLNQKEIVWHCKICSESREILKKSGSWFYNKPIDPTL